MATLCSITTGNWLTAGTWGLCDATSELDSEAANTALTTSYVASSAFTPGAITIDAIAVKVAVRNGTTGTMSVELYNSTLAASVAGTEVTINMSDINAGDTAANGGAGWYVFKFSSPVLLLVATNYQVRAKTSSSSQVNLFSSATSNWSRQLRTTTTQAPAAADKLIVSGDWTAAATSSTYTVTMDETATTDYGIVTVNNKGVLASAVAASTNYNLKLSGDLIVYGGGSFTAGTSGSPMPSTSTLTINFDSASASQYGLRALGGASVETFGNALTYNWTTLAADAASSATSLTTAHSTGWLNGDNIGLAATTVTSSQAETKALTAGASGTTLTIAALTNAHGGNASTGVRGHLVNLTRNVKIIGASQTNTGWVFCATSAAVSFNHTEFRYLGSSTASKYAFMIYTSTAGSLTFTGCAFWQFHASTYSIVPSTAAIANFVVTDCVGYDLGTYGYIWNQSQSSFTNCSVTDFVIIKASSGCFYIISSGLPMTDIVASSSAGGGMLIGQSNGILTTVTVNGFEAYGNGSVGLNATTYLMPGTFQNATLWRNGYGMFLTNFYTLVGGTITFDTFNFFGNSTAHILLQGNNISNGQILFKNVTANGGTTVVCPLFLNMSSGYGMGLKFMDSSFGATTAHSTADISGAMNFQFVEFENCLFSSSTEITAQTSISNVEKFPGVSSIKHDQTAGNHKIWKRYGTLTTDTTIYNTASPSERITPNNATYKVQSGSKFIAVNSGQTPSITVYVRESVVGDGTDYNGNRIRLMLRSNAALGTTTDTVLDTATVSSVGAWEQLSATLPSASSDGVWEMYLDCDGTTGWINIDDFATDANNDPRGVKYWNKDGPYVGAEYNAGGGGSGGSFTFS